MGNNGVRNIVLLVILVVMSFFLGIQASDGAKTPIIIIAGLVGVFGLLYLGEKSWMVMFYLPAIFPLLPPSWFITNHVNTAAMLCAAMLIYWLLMRAMGYVKISWQGFFPLDFILGVFFVYMCITFYRRPVGIGLFSEYFDRVGGIAYVVLFFATLGYIGRSIIPFTYESSTKLVKQLFYITLVAHVLGIIRALITGQAVGDSTLEDTALKSRFSLFAPLSVYLVYYFYGSRPLLRAITSVRTTATLIICFIGLLLSGWRSNMLAFIGTMLSIAFIKRELIICITAATGVYGALLYLSHEHLLEELPYGIQRTLCAVPGHLNVKKSIRTDTESSTKWRQVMWRWALDPRTKLINDYIFGDGPGDDTANIKRMNLATIRGALRIGDQRSFAARGTWHSGWITVIHRLGIVGLFIVALCQAIGLFMVITVCRAYEKTPVQKYIIPLIAPFAGSVLGFHISAGNLDFFIGDMFSLTLAKILYAQARKKGMVPNFFRQQAYIPMAIQELETQNAPKQAA